MRFLEKLKKKWNVERTMDIFLICLVFSLAGASIGFFRRPIFHALGITAHTPLWIKVVIYIPLIVPIYQFNLVVYGFIFGQFEFFWEKEKKLGRFLLKCVSPAHRRR